MKKLLTLLALAVCTGVFAETFTFNTLADWQNNANLSEADGVITAKGQVFMQGKKRFDYDATKTYTLSCDAKITEGERKITYLGVRLFDKENRQINGINVNPVANSDTELAAPIVKGDTVIKVKDASAWKPSTILVVVFNTKPDLSDLPNFNVLPNSAPTKIEKVGDVWEVTVAKPMVRDVAAGTPVRLQTACGFMYIGGSQNLTAEWRLLTGKASGMDAARLINNKFAPGTAAFELILLANWNQGTGTTAEYKNITLSVE